MVVCVLAIGCSLEQRLPVLAPDRQVHELRMLVFGTSQSLPRLRLQLQRGIEGNVAELVSVGAETRS